MSTTDAAAFQRDGYLLVRGMWADAEVRAIRSAVARALDDGLDSTGVRVFSPERTPPALLRVCTEDPMRSAVRAIVGPRVEFLSVKPVVKTSAILGERR